MWTIPVFEAERKDGLEEAVRTSASVAWSSVAQIAHPEARTLFAGPWPSRVRASATDQPDLHPLSTILVTSCWNLNGDVFERLETWAARHTPEDKPFNYEHVCDDIIGHITGNQVVNIDLEPVPDDTSEDKVPDVFHIVTSAVLYKIWEDEKLQERMDLILEEIAKAMWYVSMEALFKGFDYALKAKDGSVKIVTRNERTAFLTKHLQAYGGAGVYEQYKVGRLLRNIVFSGKGLVKKPANPDSIIFDEPHAFNSKGTQIIGSMEELGYGTVTGNKERTNMAIDADTTLKIEKLEAKNKDLKQQVETLTVAQKQGDADKVKAREDAFKSEVAEATSRAAAAEERLAAAHKLAALADVAAKAAQTKMIENEKVLATTKAELDEVRAQARKAARVARLKACYECDDVKANELYAKFAAMPDEAFEAHASYMSEKLTEYKNAKSPTEVHGKGDNDEPKPKPNPTTVAKQPPAATDKPAPMGGQPTKVKTMAADLATATPTPDAALSAVVTDDGVEKVRAEVIDFMGDFFHLGEVEPEDAK